jgi:hypothetical protein
LTAKAAYSKLLIMDEKAFLDRLDKIIVLLEDVNRQPSLLMRVGNGIAMGVGIMGIISIIDIIRIWLGGSIMVWQLILSIALIISSVTIFFLVRELKKKHRITN